MKSLEIPSSWAFTSIEEISIKGDQRKPDPDECFTYIDISSIDRVTKRISSPQKVMGKNAPSRARKVVGCGDVIVSLTRPNLNAVALVAPEHDGQIASTGFEVIKPVGVDSRFIFALTKSRDFIDSISGKVQGALYPAAKSSDVKAYEFPLPPLAEQQQIAEQLDLLLAQVDSIKARLDALPAILKRFRQSVLAAAVSGKLTEEWRAKVQSLKATNLNKIQLYWEQQYYKENRKYIGPKLNTPESTKFEIPRLWQWCQLGEVFDVYVGATPSRKEPLYWNGSINWVSSSEVSFCRIQGTKETITTEGLHNTSTNIHPPGTVMLAMIGQGKTRGQPAILDVEACHNQNTAALRVPSTFCVPEFLYYFLFERYEDTRRAGSGNNQQAMNKKIVQSLLFPLPPMDEQLEIVRRIDQLFAFADQVEQQVKNAQARVNKLTQSILAKAFRGELTAQWRADNPELISGDNSAEALLARIQAERVTQTKKKPRKRAS